LRAKPFNHLLCDLDGTLVDSSAGILDTLRRSLASFGKHSQLELNSRLIGPPLRELVRTAAGSDDPELIRDIEAAFIRDYDAGGCLAMRAYPGIAEALVRLREHAVRVHVVTNKRLVPTVRILDKLGWASAFSTVNTVDSNVRPTNKSDVVARLLAELETPSSSAVLVGDSLDDARAARDNGVAFGWASWGYGEVADLRGLGTVLIDADDLVQIVLRGDAPGVARGA